MNRHAFYCGLLNSLPMGFYSPSQLVQDAKPHVIDVRIAPLDVQESSWDHRLSPEAAEPCARLTSRPGAASRAAYGQGAVGGKRPHESKLPAPSGSPEDLMRRSSARYTRELRFLATGGSTPKNLVGAPLPVTLGGGCPAQADAPRGIRVESDQQGNDDVGSANGDRPETAIELPVPGIGDDMMDDYRYTSLTLGPHPMALLRRSSRVCNQCSDSARSGILRATGMGSWFRWLASSPADSGQAQHLVSCSSRSRTRPET